MSSSTTLRRFERLEERKLFSLSNFLVESSLPKESQDSALIYLPEISGLRAASVELTYNQDLVKIDPKSLRAGSIWGNRGLAIANVDEEAGRIVAFIFASREVPAGAGSLLEFDFTHNDSNHSSQDQLEFIIESLSLNEGKIATEAEGEGTAEITWSRPQPETDYPDKNHAIELNDPKTKPPRISKPLNPVTPSIALCSIAPCFVADKKPLTTPSQGSRLVGGQSNWTARENISLPDTQPKPEMVAVPKPEPPPIRPSASTHPFSLELPSIANRAPFRTVVSVVYGPEELRLDDQASVENLENSTEIGPHQLQFPWYEAGKRPGEEKFHPSRDYPQVEGKIERGTDRLGALPNTELLSRHAIVEFESWYVMEQETHKESDFRKALPPVFESNTRAKKIVG
ncbi:hypothetical protein SH449x_005360 [Pirellulaceae bacterium SH449]